MSQTTVVVAVVETAKPFACHGEPPGETVSGVADAGRSLGSNARSHP